MGCHDHRAEHNGKRNYASRSGTAGATVWLFKSPLILQKAVGGVDFRLIWYFLAGWIAGAVGTVMFATWWIKRHAKRVTADEMIRTIEETRHGKEDKR